MSDAQHHETANKLDRLSCFLFLTMVVLTLTCHRVDRLESHIRVLDEHRQKEQQWPAEAKPIVSPTN